MTNSASCAFAVACLVAVGTIQHASADESFNQDDWAPASSWEAKGQEMEKNLLSEVEKALGIEQRQVMVARIAKNEEGMSPIYASLTKNKYGKLDHASVRYMLHRYFVQEHGWFIEGLFTEGSALNSSSPTHALKDRVPLYVQGLFEKQLGGQGFGLHEMAVLVAVIQNSVHEEAQRELNNTYKVLGLSFDTNFTKESAKLLVERYMTSFILRKNMSETNTSELNQLLRDMPYYYPTWPRAKKFFSWIRINHSHGLSVLQYQDMWKIIEDIVDTFGLFQGKQCQGLKQQLKDLETKDSSGCVRLSDFYSKGLKGDSNWLFVESPHYLRHIGALDEADPKNPRVLTSNYINGPNSCLQPSGYYLVCCHNECDDILGHVEKRLAAPSASPKDILRALPASSVLLGAALRATPKLLISPSLIRKLDEIATYHEGRVPIHGRLFAQWLHHAYPRECPYPHVSGTKNPEWIEEYEVETGKASTFTDDEMIGFIVNNTSALTSKTVADGLGSCAPWQDEEELFAPLPIPPLRSLSALEEDPHVWRVASSCALLAVVATMVIHALRTYRSLLNQWHQPKMLQV